jgi:hypothetical protein
MFLRNVDRGVRYDHTIDIMDVAVLQRFIALYAAQGAFPIEGRTALENALRSPHLKIWARGLPTTEDVSTAGTTGAAPA